MQTERKSSMKRKIFNSRTLALILVLAMAVSLFTISASAATSESLSGHGSNISTNAYGTGTATNSFTLARGETQIVRVIVQDNTTTQPYIGYVILKGGR